MQTDKPYDIIKDYVTGETIPDIGAEANRQAVERALVEEKGYSPSDIAVGMPVSFVAAGREYSSEVDLVVFSGKHPFMVIKCAAGSLDSRKTEAVATARILFDKIVPYSAASDGQTALIFDSVTANQIGEGMEALPDAQKAKEILKTAEPASLPGKRLEKERIIFRSYDSMNVNVARRQNTGAC